MPNTQNNPHQQGAPQKTEDMPSSGNSPHQTGTDEAGGTQDVERSGIAGSTRRAPDASAIGDLGRIPGKTEGVENPEAEGNQ